MFYSVNLIKDLAQDQLCIDKYIRFLNRLGHNGRPFLHRQLYIARNQCRENCRQQKFVKAPAYLIF